MSLLAPAASAAGSALAGAARALGAALDRGKPLHPHGVVYDATVIRRGSDMSTGVPLIDETGELPAVVRVSRGVGFPEPLPDVTGIAIRIDPGHAPADVLLASTGTGRLGRFLLAPRLRSIGTTTSLLPYRSPIGPLNLGAFPLTNEPSDGSERRFDLRWAVAAGAWHPFATLRLDAPHGDPEGVSFDPVLNVPVGLEQFALVRMLREPAYRTARAHSGRTTR